MEHQKDKHINSKSIHTFVLIMKHNLSSDIKQSTGQTCLQGASVQCIQAEVENSFLHNTPFIVTTFLLLISTG